MPRPRPNSSRRRSWRLIERIIPPTIWPPQSPEDLVDKATWTHFYVFYEGTELVGTGAIGSYWGKADEASLFDIFVSPEYQGKGIGRAIVTTLEQDAFFKTAKRVEIPASITALGFYEKLGYRPKNHQTRPDNEQLFRLEKFTGVSPK